MSFSFSIRNISKVNVKTNISTLFTKSSSEYKLTKRVEILISRLKRRKNTKKENWNFYWLTGKRFNRFSVMVVKYMVVEYYIETKISRFKKTCKQECVKVSLNGIKIMICKVFKAMIIYTSSHFINV